VLHRPIETAGILGMWEFSYIDMSERVGFEALNVEPCSGLHGLVQAQKTKHLSAILLSPNLIEVF
jgi:hypothetical protein